MIPLPVEGLELGTRQLSSQLGKLLCEPDIWMWKIWSQSILHYQVILAF